MGHVACIPMKWDRKGSNKRVSKIKEKEAGVA